MKRIDIIIAIAVIVLLAIVMTSCTSRHHFIVVESTVTGQVMKINDTDQFTKLGDTLVIMNSNYSNTLYGKYKGVIPKNKQAPSGNVYTYQSAVRIK